LGTWATSVIGVKSFSASYGMRLYSHGLMACVATAPITTVWPSAGAWATRPAPMLPPAPGLFSTITLPRLAAAASASERAAASSGPPAG